MKSVLVTGGSGFIGSNFLNYMVKTYDDVQFYNLDCINYCSSNENVYVKEYPNYTFIKGNIQNAELIDFILYTHNIDTVVHFAAQSHVDYSFDNSVQYTMDNILGTHILLECCKNYKRVTRFIHISTDEVYGESDYTDDESAKKTEKSVMCPTNPYAATKAGAELIARSYFYSYNFPVIITRGNNVYGPNQYIDKVIPKFITKLLLYKKCTIHGNGSNQRAYIFVDDVVSAIEKVLKYGEIGEIYNIGSQDELSVLQLAEKLIKKIYLQPTNINFENYIEFIKDRPYNDKRYYVCDEKLKKLGWTQKVDINSGLKKTIEWYKENKNRFI